MFQCFPFTGIGPEAESNPVTLRIKYGIIPKKRGKSKGGRGITGAKSAKWKRKRVAFIPIRLRQSKVG